MKRFQEVLSYEHLMNKQMKKDNSCNMKLKVINKEKDAFPKNISDFDCDVSLAETTGYHLGRGLFSLLG